MGKNDMGVVLGSSAWDCESYIIKKFSKKYLLQNITVTLNRRYCERSVPIAVPENKSIILVKYWAMP
jgi:hypothetical protein